MIFFFMVRDLLLHGKAAQGRPETKFSSVLLSCDCRLVRQLNEQWSGGTGVTQ